MGNHQDDGNLYPPNYKLKVEGSMPLPMMTAPSGLIHHIGVGIVFTTIYKWIVDLPNVLLSQDYCFFIFQCLTSFYSCLRLSLLPTWLTYMIHNL